MLFTLFCLSFPQTFAQDTASFRSGSCIPVKSLEENDLAYGAGEYMKYAIHYTWGILDSDVGTATVTLDTVRVNGQKAFHCKFYGTTGKWYDWMFKVREDFQSWFTTDGIVPLKFTRNTLEGKYTATNNFDYIWDAEKPYVDADVYSSSSGQRTLQLPLDHCTFDLPALFYIARNMDFDNITPDVRYPMTFVIDDDVYEVYFILKGREKRKFKGIGTVNTIKFGAKLLAGKVFTGEEDMYIWVTDDDNRMLVYFEAPILVGVVEGRLEAYSGLKHEFTSLIKK